MRQVAFVLLTGYILAFYSEWGFWLGRPASEFFWLEAVLTWLGYSCLAYFFVAALIYFRAQSIWAYFLAGAIYGWLGEGVLVQTMYNDFGLNISWTGLAWHSLFSVLFGIYYLPKKLREGRALLPCLLVGLAFGLWSIGWWLEPEVQVMIATIGDGLLLNVLLYNFYFGLLLIPAYTFWLRFDIAEFQINRIAFFIMLGIALYYYAFITVPTQPLALIILPICLCLALFGLWKNRQTAPAKEKVETTIRPSSLWPLLLIPIIVSLVYTLGLIFGIALPSLIIVYVLTLPAGFILFFVALWKVSRTTQSQTNQ